MINVTDLIKQAEQLSEMAIRLQTRLQTVVNDATSHSASHDGNSSYYCLDKASQARMACQLRSAMLAVDKAVATLETNRRHVFTTGVK